MENLYVVFKCDNHHSWTSLDLLGVAGTQTQMLSLVREQTHREERTLSRECVDELKRMRQTQSYSGDGQFLIQEATLNELI